MKLLAVVLAIASLQAFAAPRPCFKQAKDAVLAKCEQEHSDSDCYIDNFEQITLDDNRVSYFAYVNIVNMGFAWKSYLATAEFTRSARGRYTCRNVKAE